MFVLILQTALLLAIAFILGCIVGCVLRTISADSGKSALPTPVDNPALTSPAPMPAPVSAQAEDVASPEPVALKATEPAKKSAQPKRAAPKKPAAPKKATPKKAAENKRQSAPAKSTKKPPAKKAGAGSPPKAGSKVDNLKLISGIGIQNEARLQAFGVTKFGQIAEWKKADAEEWGERLAFPGRIEREDWIGQAKILAKGGSTQFASRVRQGTVSTSVGEGTVGDLGKKPRLLANARKSGPDNLTLIDGVGKALEKRLNAIGIFHFDQIAKLDADEARWVGIAVGYPGRVERENWVEESQKLADQA